jgi:hypothetical protein
MISISFARLWIDFLWLRRTNDLDKSRKSWFQTRQMLMRPWILITNRVWSGWSDWNEISGDSLNPSNKFCHFFAWTGDRMNRKTSPGSREDCKSKISCICCAKALIKQWCPCSSWYRFDQRLKGARLSLFVVPLSTLTPNYSFPCPQTALTVAVPNLRAGAEDGLVGLLFLVLNADGASLERWLSSIIPCWQVFFSLKLRCDRQVCCLYHLMFAWFPIDSTLRFPVKLVAEEDVPHYAPMVCPWSYLSSLHHVSLRI